MACWSSDLGRALGWRVSSLKGTRSGFRTIALSQEDSYARYIKQRPAALPSAVEIPDKPSTPGEAMADWIRRTWESCNTKYRLWLEEQFIRAFSEAEGIV